MFEKPVYQQTLATHKHKLQQLSEDQVRFDSLSVAVLSGNRVFVSVSVRIARIHSCSGILLTSLSGCFHFSSPPEVSVVWLD